MALPIIRYSSDLTKELGVGFSIHFTTNGTLLNKKVRELLSPYPVSFQITLDGYGQYHDSVRNMRGIGTYRLIMSHIKEVATLGKSVVLRVNFTQENIESLPKIISELSEWSKDTLEYINVDLQHVWQDISISDERIISNKIQEVMEKAALAGIRISSPWKAASIQSSCYADKRNHMLVNYNGDLYFCTARDFDPSKRKGYLNAEGVPVWENDAHNTHMSVKFMNPVCQQCRIGALCGGGCRQKTMECLGREGCSLGFSEYDKDDIILRRFERLVIVPYLNKNSAGR